MATRSRSEKHPKRQTGLAPAELSRPTKSSSSSAAEGSAQVRRLEAEITGLRRALRTRGLIEQAKGRLAERLGIDPEQAFRHLATQSQRANVPVFDLAADVMAARPSSTEDGGIDAARREVKLRAGIGAATGPVDLVAALTEQDWLGAEAVALFAAQPGGALLLIAAQGWPAKLRGDVRWVPSLVRTPASEAIRRAEPIWLDESGPFIVVGPGSCRAALPIRVDGATVAAVEVALPAGHRLDPPTRRLLCAAAEALGDWFATAVTSEDSFGPLAGSLAALLDGIAGPAALISPLWIDSGGDPGIDDFRINHVNPAAATAWHTDEPLHGRRLLDIDPDALHNGTFDEYVRSFHGLPPPTDTSSCRAIRVADQLLVTWLPRGAESVSSAERMATMEELGSFGWGEWSDSGEPLTWSPGLAKIVGSSSTHSPLGLEGLMYAVTPDDRAIARAAIDGVLRDGMPASVEVRLSRPDGDVRSVRLMLASRRAHDSSARSVTALLQDRTEARLGAEAIANTAERLASQRLRSAFERAQTEQLRSAFFPPPWASCQYGPLSVVARHVAPTGVQSFRGDFYEIDESDAGMLVTVGDVFGSGIAAAHTMVRLRYGARALRQTGLPVADVGALLNSELCREEDPPLASMVLANVDPDGRSLRWAQAGHYSPILVRQGRARSLRRPRGDILGLLASSQYGSASVQLQPGDLVLLFTDGLFQRWNTGVSPIRWLLAECQKAQREGGAQVLFERLLPPAEDEACLVALEWEH